MKINKIILILYLTFHSFNAQTFENYDINNSDLPSNVVTSITIVNDVIWATTDNGIATFDGTAWHPYTIADGLSSNYLRCSNQQLGIDCYRLVLGSDSGTTSFSIDNMDISSLIDHLNISNSEIISNNIFSLTSWYDGSSWIGTDNGISMVQPDTIRNIQVGMSGILLNNNVINSLTISNDTVTHKSDNRYVPLSGVVYAATNGGGVGRFYLHEVDGITSASIVEKNWSGLSSDTVLSVFVDDNNNHWYGTPYGAASHYEHNSKYAKWKRYNSDDGLVDNYVISITSDNDGNIWFGTRGGISRFDGENWISYTKSDGLASNEINDIQVDSDDNIWIATDKGLSKLSNITSIGNEKYSSQNIISFRLDAYPNPFNPSTTISYSIPEFPLHGGDGRGGLVTLKVYDIVGKKITTIVNKNQQAGSYEVIFNANNLSSGIYFFRLQVRNYSITKKAILLK